MNRDRTVAVVLHYRTPELAIACARSIAPQLDPARDRLVVVDNGSDDGSVARLRAALAQPELAAATLLETRRNGGFAFGHNAAIRAFPADHHLLVNSDARLTPGALERLRARLDADPRLAVVSPRLEDESGRAQTSCFRFHTPWSELVHAAATGPISRLLARHVVPLPVRDEPEEAEWTSFACVLVRDAALAEVGLLDEEFFLYYEDVDLCRRLGRAGWKVGSVPAARVVHRGGASSGVDAPEGPLARRPRYFYASRARYFRKHFGASGLLAANLAWSAGRVVSLLRETFGAKRRHCVDRELLDRWRA
jgi:GT2 family glycosyltransferase